MKLEKNILASLMRTKFVRDSLWLLISYSLLALIGIVINIYITRTFGTAAFGSFSLALKIYLIASLVGTLGSGVSVLKYSAELSPDRAEFKSCLTAAILVGMLAGSLMMIIQWLTSTAFEKLFENPDLRFLLDSMAWAIPVFCLNKIFLGILNGQRKMKFMSVMLSLRWALLFIFVALLANRFGFRAIGWSFLITELVLFLILFIRFAGHLSFAKPGLQMWLTRHVRFGSRSITSNIILDIYYYLDVFMIGIFMNATSVGVYSFASDLAKNLLIPANILETSVNPKASRLSAEEKLQELQQMARRIRNSTYLLYIPFTLLALTTYPFFIEFINDPALNDSIAIFFLLTMGTFAISGFKPLFSITEMAGYPMDRTVINVVTLAINGLFNILLFFPFGMTGVALATVISYIFSIFALNISAKKRLALHLFS